MRQIGPLDDSAMQDVIVVILAPLHSAVLPRKVLRRLNGEPILKRLITVSSASVASRSQIVVLTDDDEVALLAEREGCQTVLVAPEESDDLSRPDLVLRAVSEVEGSTNKRFKLVARLSPSVPLVSSADLRNGIEVLLTGPQYNSVVSTCRNTHRLWTKAGDSYRVYADCAEDSEDELFEEVPSFVVTRRECMTSALPVVEPVGVAPIPAERSLEMRSPLDWWSFDRSLRRRRVVFVVIGDLAVGMGHVFRSLQLAHELLGHETLFVVPRGHSLAVDQIRHHRYPVVRQGEEDLAATVLALDPDLVVNDVLQTNGEYVERLKEDGRKVVNFEDEGDGALHADLVINAIFDKSDVGPNVLCGPTYFCIRDEFVGACPCPWSEGVREVLVTFGGTDEKNVTQRVAGLVLPLLAERGIRVSIVTGPGYLHLDELRRAIGNYDRDQVELANGTRRISEYMARADLGFSSAGRTVFELAMMRVPSFILAANLREESHTFASEENGMIYLGRQDRTSDEEIVGALMRLLEDRALRKILYERTARWDFTQGRGRVMAALTGLLEQDERP